MAKTVVMMKKIFSDRNPAFNSVMLSLIKALFILAEKLRMK